MDSRTKLAAATASVVPFHCVICFEEFSLTDRLPVVLPCGHTFVCVPCSSRLKRCMECREPLFISLPSSSGNKQLQVPLGNTRRVSNSLPGGMYSRGNGRMSPSLQYPSTPPQSSVPAAPPVQIPLPIPKNVVLISMMEAAARQSIAIDDSDESSVDEDEEEAYDLNRIISGMATLSGPCGTYVVRESDALVVLPNHPNRRSHDGEGGNEGEEVPDACHEPVQLTQGQTLQVVNFEDGVAKLARGAGYVVANSSQLVKVNGPLDSNCRLEGLLDTVIRRGQDLQKELDENSKIEKSLRKEIQAGLLTKPTEPIISAPPELSVSGSFDRSETECSTPVSTKTNTGKDEMFIRTPEQTRSTEFLMPASPTELSPYENRPFPQVTRGTSIDNADIPRLPCYRQMPDENSDFIYGCGVAWLGNGALFTNNVQDTNTISEHLAIEDEQTVLQIQANNRTIINPTIINPGLSPSRAASFDSVDFRTGMSGHRALNAAKSKVALSPNQRGGRLMMSQHTGIARVRGPFSKTKNPSV